MPDTVRLRENLGIIEVHSFGETSNKTMLESRKALVQICQKTDVAGILVDARESNSIPSIFAVLDFGANLFNYDFIPRTTRFAVVPPEKKKEDCEFFATVCQKRGLLMQLFDTVNEAEEWVVDQQL